MKLVTALVAGLLFGGGLVISGLGNPAKVQNFLDVAGTWDASLALVMAAAVLITGIGYRAVWQRPAPLFETRFHVPAAAAISPRLLFGAALFGVGWGLSGFCPGPALVAVTQLGASTLLFVLAMVAGMWAARLLGPGPDGPETASR